MDISGFHRWAAGNLVDNRNRGIFAEWLIGQALEVIDPRDVRKEWDAVDLRYGDIGIEVKSSGLSQTWHQVKVSTPRFDVSEQSQWWDSDTDTWGSYDPPRRTADVSSRNGGLNTRRFVDRRGVLCYHEWPGALQRRIFESVKSIGG